MVKTVDHLIDVFFIDSNESLAACYVEVGVTLKDGNAASFPDAVTTRGQKRSVI